MRNGADSISLMTLMKRTAKRVKKLKRIYSELCTSGTSSEQETFFADNFHTVISHSASRPSRALKERFIRYDGGFPVADAVISASDDRLPSADEIIMIVGKQSALRRIYGSEIEYLSFTVAYTLIKKISECVKTWDKSLTRYITLLSDLGSLDMTRLNDVLNPVAIKLSEDSAYKKSDPKTRLEYREMIYLTAVKFDLNECALCDELLEKYRGEDIDIGSLTVMRKRKASPKIAVIAAIGLTVGAAVISLAIAVWADALWAAVLLFLPAMEALRPFSDRIISRNKGVTRLMRLDTQSEEVKSTRTAIVLSAAVSGAEDAAELYDKLLRLHCLNPAGNICVCALVDLPAEQVPITSEDRAVIESLSEMISKLNAVAFGKFSCIVRKRSFSETQQEYMGAERKRGALLDLARYMKYGDGDFYALLGSYQTLRGIDYICAADSDTYPLMDSVNELLAIALHPANKVSIVNGYLTRGYGIIAPRMVTRLYDSLRSEFAKSLGGIGSRSSYDEESASIYQDVFGRGTFCGKGLINVTALLSCTAELRGERILSHDILEGELLRTAYAGDVIFTEGFPRSPQSYYRRLDRWIRGDFQNIPEIFSGRYDALSKLKLLDNLRRAATPLPVLLSMFAGFCLYPPSGAIVAGMALLLWLFPSILGTFSALVRDRTLGRRYYSGLLSTTSQGLRYILYSVIMLPTLAVKTLRAIITALWRLITKRNLLEWTTADASDRASLSPLRFYLLPELLSLSLLWSPDYFIRLMGAIFAAMPALLAINDSESQLSDTSLSYRDSREISKQTADMWGFFENYVTRLDNDLPPDNVQFAPVYRIAHRTSPTNIGLYMLSCLAAYDRKLISKNALLERLDRTLGSVERLEKYRGNLYNWYDTQTLKICPPQFVSSVDSGNFVVCLVTLKEGLSELEGERARQLARRVEKLIHDTDLGTFYDPVRGLMAISIEPENGERGRSHYDYLMSEARLTSFWGIASRQVPKSHWQRLSRAMLSSGFFGGAASYSGTMFEFFMPEIFLKSPEGSLFNESLKYALWVQKKYAKSFGRPYGISESGYYSFDPALNYRYMAHGVPNTGIRRGLENNYVISPYSTYISLGYSPSDAAENLRKIAEYGMYGSYGLYEALDFTAPDAQGPEPVRSYMAHHVGMSILSCDNALSGGIMQKRFMRDLRVRGALELLDERFYLGTAVFENTLRRPRISAPEVQRQETEIINDFSLSDPKVKLLCNGEMTLAVADNGACSCICRSKNVYMRTRDFRRPQGIFSYICDGGEAVSMTYLPDLAGGMTAEFSEDAATFYRNTEKLSAGMKVRLHAEYPCEIRTFALKNETSAPLEVSLINYIEPSLQDTAAEQAHPAYSKMFLRLERDLEWDIITVTRVREDKKLYLGIGFLEDVQKTVSFDRGEVLSSPDGLSGLKIRFGDIPPSLISEPDPCVYIRAVLEMPPKSDAELSMFLLCAESREELINRISTIRRKKPRYCTLPRLDTASGRVASALLPKILYHTDMSEPKREGIMKNNLPLNALWEISVATELPMVLVALNQRNDDGKLAAYLGAYKLLRRCGIELQLVFAYDDGGRYEREHYNDLIAAARTEELEGSVYSSGGILPLDLSKARDGLWALSCAAACHICIDEIASIPERTVAKKYMEVLPSEPILQPVEMPVACGGFAGDGYVINEKTPLPWCHVLSNPVFGTLLSNNSLGFTYAFNSRENRLTPWDNDPMRDNTGERLLLFIDGKVYDLIRGSAAVFKPYKAEYFAYGDGFEARTEVTVSAKGMCKRIRVQIKAGLPAKLCYYTEPCMGVTREHSEMILPEKTDGGLLLSSHSSELGGFMFIKCSKDCKAMTDRGEFWSGNLSEHVEPSARLCGTVWCEVEGRAEVDFHLSYGPTRQSAIEMPKHFSLQTDTREHKLSVKTDDAGTDRLVNTWLRYQALHARIYARTGFYQCSGAYGFRDQLQDACGIVLENPHVLKTQILRCCRAQFIEGDVLHWWHSLPNKKMRGIRTKMSDDALWLPYALAEYLDKTGDDSILNLNVCYCDGIALSENEHERYGEVFKTSTRESVYMHCRRAIDFRAGKTGSHGLMLIGTGDWNDGFNEVGKDGSGESVWLTEFYIIVLERFAIVSEKIGDKVYADSLREYATALRESVETAGRDKEWYLRGYFDDGSPLGSHRCDACRIDSIAQSFAEFAGLGRDGFVRTALESAYLELCDLKRGVIKLFTPAFPDDAEPDPGYVRCYPDGLRENGGQYTHGAVWLGMACLKAGMVEQGCGILSALSPIRHSADGGYERYKTEPYYLCGDVYANKNCLGRGGWSIYTGSAAWYYRALTEGLLGIRLCRGTVNVDRNAPVGGKIAVDGETVRR